MIVKGGRSLLGKMQNRLILSMSIFDILQSISIGLATLPIPKDSACTLYALGNRASCIVQAFSFQLGFAVPNYVAMLCIYYMCIIKLNMHDETIKKYELYMHAYAIVPPLTIAIIAVSNDLFNNFCTMCWLAERDKYDISQIGKGDDDPGSLLLNLLSAATVFFLIADFGIIFWSMFAVRRTATQEGGRSRRSRFQFHRVDDPQSPSNSTSGSVSDATYETKIQATLYVIGFLATYLIPMFLFCLVVFGGGSSPFPLLMLQSIFQPLQGFWNFFTFIRPKFKVATTAHPEKSLIERLYITVFRNIEPSTSTLRISRRNLGRRPRSTQMIRPGQTLETAENETSINIDISSAGRMINTDTSGRASSFTSIALLSDRALSSTIRVDDNLD